VRVSPTLVKYAEPSVYEMETRKELQQAARELMAVLRLPRLLWSICWKMTGLRSNSPPLCCTSIRTILTARSAKRVSGLSAARVNEIV